MKAVLSLTYWGLVRNKGRYNIAITKGLSSFICPLTPSKLIGLNRSILSFMTFYKLFTLESGGRAVHLSLSQLMCTDLTWTVVVCPILPEKDPGPVLGSLFWLPAVISTARPLPEHPFKVV